MLKSIVSNSTLRLILSLGILSIMILTIILVILQVNQQQNPYSYAAKTTRNKSYRVNKSRMNKYDLRSFYPNTSMYQTYYLEGLNYINQTSPSRAVLWFEKQDQYTFKQYNFAPEDANSRCHWDQLSWWDDGYLRHVKTHDECPGVTPNEIVYDPPIIYIPRYWNGKSPWSYQGKSNATYYQNGVQKCTGVNSYTASIIGWEQIAPRTQAIHFRNQQNTRWLTGNISGGCYAGYTTRWQEDYWLYPYLPIDGKSTKARALKRSSGGNLDVPSDRWDIWFDMWKKLP